MAVCIEACIESQFSGLCDFSTCVFNPVNWLLRAKGLTDLSKKQLWTLQKADSTLEKIRQVVSTNHDGTSQQFYEKDGLMYRRWIPPHRCSDDMQVKQLILPVQRHRGVLQLAHTIPLTGHLGKDKMAQQILQRFYWPTLYKDVEDYCHSCVTCQKLSRQHGPRAPLMPVIAV